MMNCPPKVLSAYQNDIKLMLKHKTDKNLLTLALSVAEEDGNKLNMSGSLFDL